MFKKFRIFKETNRAYYENIRNMTIAIFVVFLLACLIMKLFTLALNEYETNKAQKLAQSTTATTTVNCPSCGCVCGNREE